MRQFYTYIVCSKTGTLYVGMTNDLERRVREHKRKLVPGFTAKYGCDRLVWYEAFPTALLAIAAEKRIKGWARAKKVALVEDQNPKWEDLAADWDEPEHVEPPSCGDRLILPNRHPEVLRGISLPSAPQREEIPRSTSG